MVEGRFDASIAQPPTKPNPEPVISGRKLVLELWSVFNAEDKFLNNKLIDGAVGL